ncbi:MAG: basic secretory protein-like protein [Planctomycetota bacterium]|nr:basic secretory protein-like protein [Planctomycetota bacterium]
MRCNFAFILIAPSFLSLTSGEEAPVTIKLHSEVPALQEWGAETQELLVRWHPRISNLLPTEDFKATRILEFRIRKTDKGVGATSGNRITVSSHWIEKHPDDVGMVVHELVHVIQAYSSAKPWWITEGIADYIRWAIFEGKPQSWFPRPAQASGYKKGYRVSAGFLLWLESGKAPGIVKKLNTAMRHRKYSDEIFKNVAGSSLDDLWNDYCGLEQPHD